MNYYVPNSAIATKMPRARMVYNGSFSQLQDLCKNNPTSIIISNRNTINEASRKLAYTLYDIIENLFTTRVQLFLTVDTLPWDFGQRNILLDIDRDLQETIPRDGLLALFIIKSDGAIYQFYPSPREIKNMNWFTSINDILS